MTTGTMVQTTSISALWVVREGLGLARALNRIITTRRRISTKAVIAVIITKRKL
jgi:hypothetical protein